MSDDHAEDFTYDGPEHHTYAGTYGDLQQAARTAAAAASGNWLRQATAPLVAEAQADSYTQEQLQELRKGQDMRDGAPNPLSNYPAHSHEELHRMVTEDLTVNTINGRGEVMSEMGNWLSDVSAKANDAVKTEQAHWQGPGANQAHALFAGHATWADGTAQAAWLSANRYADQADGAAQAQSQMPPPTHFDEQAEMTQVREQLSSGNLVGGVTAYTDMLEKKQHAQQQHHEAVRVMDTMDQSYHQTATTQPAFQPPPTPGSGDSGSTSASSFVAGGTPSSGSINVPGGTNSYSAPTSTPGSTTGSPTPVTGAGRNYSASAPPSSSSTTGYGGYNGSSTGAGAGRNVYGAAEATGRPGSLRGVGSETTRGGSSRGTSGGSRAGGSAPRSSGSASSRVTGSGGAKGDAPERAASGKSTGSSPVSKSTPVARGGAAAAAKAESGATGRPIGGAPGGGRGGKGDDEEHERKYDYGEDPEEIYEPTPEYTPDGQKVVKPVIGE